ncbi:hypothetical protein [Rubrivivax gelatinosus]|uniref:hypothetical protein n=1 Tax=Rubrivivax gelatinosus TaxID=28068 RepID=UPI0005C1A7EA|nr:hypothetical protein [Rubrivivax gelatinosus]MBG6082979.1 hypothetical protein [Rubrivivax gelatinosus]
MNLSQEQKNAGALLKRALEAATSSGLLDDLAGLVSHPDVINGFCDGFDRLVAGEDLVNDVADQVEVEHWNSPTYGGDELEHQGVTFTAEVVDMRARSGQLLVNIGDNNGAVDDSLSAAFEVTTTPGSKAPVPSLMLYEGEEVVAKVIRQPNGHLIMPWNHTAHIVPTSLPNGERAWILLDR